MCVLSLRSCLFDVAVGLVHVDAWWFCGTRQTPADAVRTTFDGTLLAAVLTALKQPRPNIISLMSLCGYQLHCQSLFGSVAFT